MNDIAWIEKSLKAARPKAVAALLRYFRDLDTAEEAFQEACLRALGKWPLNGPPKDPAAWLIFVGRNAALDGIRKQNKLQALPDEAKISDLSDVETPMAERLDHAHFRDDILRLLFICCHPDLPNTQQIALALRVVSGLSVGQIAKAFLVGERAMEQRITRAKRKVKQAEVDFETPDTDARAERLHTVSAMIYLVFNEGYTAAGETREPKVPLCEEAIRLGRLICELFPRDAEMAGLLALMLLQYSRTAARFTKDGDIILLEDQDRTLWNKSMIEEGLTLLDNAMALKRPGPYQIQAAIAATHTRASRATETNWTGIVQLYDALERMTPSPVITLNKAVAISKAESFAAALEVVEPLEPHLAGYFYFHGVRGHLLAKLGRLDEARAAYTEAISLAQSASEAAHIRQELDNLSK
ncbi:RNA polymerase sigma factor [Kordiimonas sp.]|uniref:RNA polymerase sigma factor n=1 Tax=Kordiimonas sp. TaxID=1970157 RepID=UPI003A90FBFB